MLIPVLHFPATCAQAIALYEAALGAKIDGVAYNRDAPDGSGTPKEGAMTDRVMHAELTIAGARLNLCDAEEAIIPGTMHLPNLILPTGEAVSAAFAQLANGGTVHTPLGPQFWTKM